MRAGLVPFPLAALGMAGFVAFAVLAIIAPLACYTLALALFGLPHVLSELRYVDRRFSRRLDSNLLVRIGAVLVAVVAVRTGTVFHLIPAEVGVPAELAGVAVLALASAGGRSRRTVLALAVATIIGTATLLAPFGTATSLSILHNLTPLGLLWQLAPQDRRTRATALAALPLLAIPLLVATGLPRLALQGLDINSDPLGAWPLADHLYVYVPAVLSHSTHAIDLFTASVVAQGGHYLAVIVILPLLMQRLDPGCAGLVAWPKGWSFAAVCTVACAVSLAVFAEGFANARLLYGIAASFHAWLEVPILILALTGSAQPVSSSPARNEPALASSETSAA